MTIAIMSGKTITEPFTTDYSFFLQNLNCNIFPFKLTAKASYCSIHYLKGFGFLFHTCTECLMNSNAMCVRIHPQANVA